MRRHKSKNEDQKKILDENGLIMIKVNGRKHDNLKETHLSPGHIFQGCEI
jgi:hypothetical protein